MVTNPHSPISSRPPVLGVKHHLQEVAGRPLHWVSAGSSGSPVLLIHGFPETWWVFHRLIPLLALNHRVIAVDLPGFGDSGNEPGDYSSAAAAKTIHALIEHLNLGPVHLSAQDIGGNTAFRLATQYPDDVRSLTAVETLLSGFGFERLSDVAHRGAWHIGAIATPGIADFVFAGRVHEYLSEKWFPILTRVAHSVTAEDLEEFTRAYSRPGAWNGPQGLYSSALRDGEEFVALASSHGLRAPILAVDGMGTSSTADALKTISSQVTAVMLDGVGHHVALEAPTRLAAIMLKFFSELESEYRTAGQ